MTTRPDVRRAPRSARILKSRLVEANRQEFDAGLAWAIDDPMVEAAAARITGARRRFVLGAATSFTYASLLAAKLSNSLAQVTLVDGTIVRPLDILSDVRASDVMIVISLSRYRGYTIDTALPFAEAGGSLVVITDSADNPLVRHASEAIVIGPVTVAGLARVSDDLSMHPETPAVSPAVVAMVIDLLGTLSSASAKGANRRFAERQRLASELGLYRD
ncbi:SIS domain-containing protein [Aeromicrobium sp.]|uniref:MurR/RpiR family transcriptional regulator n=1 Tax=Aeromicrobium sp. TaxID=1871063 RepID=UPI0019C8A5A3|nr:SIS domain-containing protein [Aeromicrobium sp.]MBC7632119.1 MurR/RpiR family transcriptional regulator [Aeromicrobium sp.]